MLSALADRRRYIVAPLYDWVLFLAAPVVAVFVGLWVSDAPWAATEVTFGSNGAQAISGLLIGVIIHAHLFAVFFRSHGNQSIFRQYRGRFVLAPLLLFAGIMFSNIFAVIVSVVATFWDVYHSGAQTFGFARLYDMRAGNPPTQGRRLDFALNQLVYAGPILAGATMLDHFEDFDEFKDVKVTLFADVPSWMTANQSYFTWAVLLGGAVFIAYYIYAQWRFAKAGHPVSAQKVTLLVLTSAVSIFVWGFNSWGEAFLIMNLFHAVQYFGLVWAKERPTLQTLLRLRQTGVVSKLLAWLVFVGITVSYGLFVEGTDGSVRAFVAITLVVSIMHFWYDGFVWSVRRKQV